MLSFRSLTRTSKGSWSNWDFLPRTDPRSAEIGLFPEHVEDVCRAAIVILNSRCAERIGVRAPTAERNHRGGAPSPLPFFSHTVVEIMGVVLDRAGIPTGRTHRSPRMHWRRGHLRHLRDAAGGIRKIIPIEPMLIGRASQGRVEHTYRVAGQRR